jgi:uncharacterized Ntn-hydrolase superfamily protein
MTFTIVARCAETGQVGVGAVTAMPGVGKLVSHAMARVGTVATQAMINPYLGFDGLRLLAEGRAPQDALDELVGEDPDRDLRQVGLVDVQGRTAAWTGAETPHWSGHLTGEDFATQGNRLVGPETLDAIADTFVRRTDLELSARILEARAAGEATGADKQGALSGSLTVYDTEEYPLWDLRVDHSDDPLRALHDLYDVFADRLIGQIRKLPTRDNPMGELDFDMEDGTV